MSGRPFRSLFVVGLASVAVLAAPRAYAQNEGAITACVSRDGRVRIAGPAAGERRGNEEHGGPCRIGERLVTWNVAGPPGQPGGAGPEGPAGAQGPAGPPGFGFIGTQYYTVGNGDLHPVGGGAFGIAFGPPPGGTFTSAAAPLLAGVHLPQNAKVLAVRANILDNSTSDLTIELIEQQLATGLSLTLSTITSAGTAAMPVALDDTLPVPHAIDNSQFHYFVRVSAAPFWVGTTLQVVGVTIAYTFEPGPGS